MFARTLKRSMALPGAAAACASLLPSSAGAELSRPLVPTLAVPARAFKLPAPSAVPLPARVVHAEAAAALRAGARPRGAAVPSAVAVAMRVAVAMPATQLPRPARRGHRDHRLVQQLGIHLCGEGPAVLGADEALGALRELLPGLEEQLGVGAHDLEEALRRREAPALTSHLQQQAVDAQDLGRERAVLLGGAVAQGLVENARCVLVPGGPPQLLRGPRQHVDQLLPVLVLSVLEKMLHDKISEGMPDEGLGVAHHVVHKFGQLVRGEMLDEPLQDAAAVPVLGQVGGALLVLHQLVEHEHDRGGPHELDRLLQHVIRVWVHRRLDDSRPQLVHDRDLALLVGQLQGVLDEAAVARGLGELPHLVPKGPQQRRNALGADLLQRLRVDVRVPILHGGVEP
mmetsp:Transcript_48484/g.134900  ORF Transcript_48484/g.134900 Transcript_48484/m.134900 type:complete len:399 (-) Transcript_48484:288-1484(-)